MRSNELEKAADRLESAAMKFAMAVRSGDPRATRARRELELAAFHMLNLCEQEVVPVCRAPSAIRRSAA